MIPARELWAIRSVKLQPSRNHPSWCPSTQSHASGRHCNHLQTVIVIKRIQFHNSHNQLSYCFFLPPHLQPASLPQRSPASKNWSNYLFLPALAVRGPLSLLTSTFYNEKVEWCEKSIKKVAKAINALSGDSITSQTDFRYRDKRTRFGGKIKLLERLGIGETWNGGITGIRQGLFFPHTPSPSWCPNLPPVPASSTLSARGLQTELTAWQHQRRERRTWGCQAVPLPLLWPAKGRKEVSKHKKKKQWDEKTKLLQQTEINYSKKRPKR